MAVDLGDESKFGCITQPDTLCSTVRCTLKLEGVPRGVMEKEIKEALEMYQVEVEQTKSLEEGIVLVTLKASEDGLQDLKSSFPILINNCSIECTKEWLHSMDIPSLVILQNPPCGVSENGVEMYLECQDIEAKIVDVNEDHEGSITLELSDPADLPYLVTKTHTMKKKPVVFSEISFSKEDTTFNLSESENIVCIEGNENIGPVSYENHALKITGIRFNETLAMENLKHRFQQDPYHLQVDRCVVEGDTAYLTFTTEQGVADVMARPPKCLLGTPIECTSVQIADVPAFQSPPTLPQVLLIRNIPIESPELFKQSLHSALVGHTIKECVIQDNEAYIKFQDQKSIPQLLANPPDNSTILGHSVIYSSVDEDQMPLSNDQCVLVVEGLPPYFSGLEEALIEYMKNTTKTQPIISCEIENGKARIKFNNSSDVKKIAEHPPNVPFHGKNLTFKTEFISYTSEHPRLKDHAFDVKRLSDILDINDLRFKASTSPFPEGDVILNIEALKPTTSVLIKGPENLSCHGVSMYCDRFGKVTDVKEQGQGKYIVSFEDKDSQQGILHQLKHSIGSQPVTVTSYHPILAEMEQADSFSSFLPPCPNDINPSIREQITPQSEWSEQQIDVEVEEWMLIMMQQPAYETLCKEAETMKVELSKNQVQSNNIHITLQGDVESVECIKSKLQKLINEVRVNDFCLKPEAAVPIDKDSLDEKCKELESKHKTAIKYSIKKAALRRSQRSRSDPHCLLHANSPNGIKVAVCSGDYTKKRCNVLTTFISETPDFQEDVFMTLTASGGHEVRSDIEASLGGRAWLKSATVHKTQVVGNLKCSELYHIVLPCYTGAPRSNAVVEAALHEFFSQVCMNNSEIIITPFTCPPLNYPVDLCAQAILNILAIKNLGIYSNLSVMIFVENTKDNGIFEEKMQDLAYHIDHIQIASHDLPVNSLLENVKIFKKEMHNLEVDVYVNFTDPDFRFHCSTKLKKICDQELLNEVESCIDTSGELKPGQVAVTSDGKSKPKAVYRVFLPKSGSIMDFKNTIHNILQEAKTHGHKSIALPIQDVIRCGYSKNEIAPAFFEEIESFDVNNPDDISFLHLTVDNSNDYKTLDSEWKKKKEMLVIAFTIYGCKQETLELVEKELRTFVCEKSNLGVHVLNQMAGCISKFVQNVSAVPRSCLEQRQDVIQAIEQMLQKAWSNQHELKILVTGKTGQGKSTLINGVLGAEVAKEGARATRCTTEVAEYSVTIQDVPVTVFDSPGLQDRTENEEYYIQSMREKCKELSLILYCTKMINPRLTDDDKHAMKKLTEAFGEKFWNYAVFVLTFANKEDCSRKDDRDDDVEEPRFDDKEGWQALKKQRFEGRLKLWEEELKQFLIKEVGVHHTIAEKIPVVPTGDYKQTQENHEPLCLPDRDNWFIMFWDACSLRVKEKKLFLQVNRDRIVAAEDDDGIDDNYEETETPGNRKEAKAANKKKAKKEVKEEVISKDKAKTKHNDDEKSTEKEKEEIGTYAAVRQFWKDFEQKHKQKPKIPPPVPKRVRKSKSVPAFPQEDQELPLSEQLKSQQISSTSEVSSPIPSLKEDQELSLSEQLKSQQISSTSEVSSPIPSLKLSSPHQIIKPVLAVPQISDSSNKEHPANIKIPMTKARVTRMIQETLRRSVGASSYLLGKITEYIAKPGKWFTKLLKSN